MREESWGYVMRLRLALALTLSMLPTLAYARPRETSVHMREITVHDRSVRLHNREPQARRHS